MARIKNTNKYPLKTPIGSDYVIGTDSENFGRTVNFRMSDVIGGEGIQLFGDILKSGGVVWLEGLTYEVSYLEYFIGNSFYTSEGGIVTLSDADDDYDRIDVFSVDIDGNIVVIEGTPSANPVKPEIEVDQIEVSFAYIPAQATEPQGVSRKAVFTEGEQEPDEFNHFGSHNNFVFDYDEDPRSGTYCMRYKHGLPQQGYARFETPVSLNLVDYSSLHFYIKIKVTDASDSYFSLALRGELGAETFIDIKHGDYGLDFTNLTDYQSVIIPLTEFGNVDFELYNITFFLPDTWVSDLLLDDFYLVSGSNNVGITGTWLGLNDTPNYYEGQAGKMTRVNRSETGLEFVDEPITPTTEWNGIEGDQKDVNLIGFTDGAYNDPEKWNSQSFPENNTFQSVTYGNGLFVAVSSTGVNRVMTSTDGETWTPIQVSNNYWYTVEYLNNLFMSFPLGGDKYIKSSDGIVWEEFDTPSSNYWTSLAYGNGLFVAVSYSGSKRIATSTDGETWTSITAPENNSWYGITYGNGLFVAVSTDGTDRIMTSPDGVIWTSVTAPAQSSWKSITYGNGLFVAVAYDGTDRIMTSPDGVIWTSATAPAQSSWSSITYGGGFFKATAFGSGSDRIMVSEDGINWSLQDIPEDNNWSDVAYGDGLFVAVAGNGTNRVMVNSILPSIQFENIVNEYRLNGVTIPVNNKVLDITFGDNSSTELLISSTIVSSRNNLLTDADGLNVAIGNTNVTITIVDDATVDYPIGTLLFYRQDAKGVIVIEGDTGVTMPSYQTYIGGDTITIRKKAVDTWEFINPPRAPFSTVVGEPTGFSTISNIGTISQANYDAAVLASETNSTTAYLITP